ncbi:MAG: hypothetical protein LBP53_02720 [Candidatus Peribacteria bacterium]|nr:hypothetical protein [Candidatus Peribacteria bacterium]
MAIISATSTAPRTSSNATTCTMAIAATDVVCSHHYSNQIFTDAVMKAGNETMPAPTGGTQV